MILLALEDVTEQRRLAQQLNETLRELERRNRELQDFASIASHDLQEPLRKIRAFSDRLTVACGDALPADARDYLARIQSAAGRMSTLITDLLSLTRVMTRGKPFERVDLRRIAAVVIIDLEEAIANADATVAIDALASVHADPTQMRQLLQNLIGNAVRSAPRGRRLVPASSCSISRCRRRMACERLPRSRPIPPSDKSRSSS